MSTPRRVVVTGHTPEGCSVIVSDHHAPDLELAGRRVRASFLWGRDDIACFPDGGNLPPMTGSVPPPGGCRFSTPTVEAGAAGEYHAFVARTMGEPASSAEAGFHRTQTLDFIYVTRGEFTLEVERAEERVLRAGDIAVLNGVWHRWHNRGEVAATLVAVMIGASTSPIPS